MLEPFEVAPVLVEKPWGGTRLSEMDKYPGRAYFGESWEIADLAPLPVHSPRQFWEDLRSNSD